MNIQDLIGWLSIILTTGYYLSSKELLLKLIKGKISTEETPIFLITINYFASLGWNIFGLILNNIFIHLSNLIGCIFLFIFIIIYFYQSSKKDKINSIINFFTLFAITLSLFVYLLLIIKDEFLTGEVCYILTLFLFISHLYITFNVFYKNNNHNLFSFHIRSTIFLLLSSISWILYNNNENIDFIQEISFIGIIVGFGGVIVWSKWGKNNDKEKLKGSSKSSDEKNGGKRKVYISSGLEDINNNNVCVDIEEKKEIKDNIHGDNQD